MAIVTFDPATLRIVEIGVGGDNELEWAEVYSNWKTWAALSDNIKYPPAFRVVGGDPISGTQDLGSTFFMMYPWKFRPAELSHRLTLVGNLFSDPAGANVIVPTLGTYTVLVEQRVSNLTDSGLDPVVNAEAVWAQTLYGTYITATASAMLSRVTLPYSVPTLARTVLADGGNSGLSFKTDLAETADNYWQDALCSFALGGLAGQVKKVFGYNGTTKVLTVGPSPGFTGTPAPGDVFVLINR